MAVENGSDRTWAIPNRVAAKPRKEADTTTEITRCNTKGLYRVHVLNYCYK